MSSSKLIAPCCQKSNRCRSECLQNETRFKQLFTNSLIFDLTDPSTNEMLHIHDTVAVDVMGRA